MTTVANLYEHCDTLDSAKELTEDHSKVYQSIISGTKGEANEKRLSSQLIVRYFSKFPSLHNEALDAMFELCEDDDVNIRKHVIKEFPHLCKEPGPHIAKIADVLVQLLQAEDVSENQAVQTALQTILKAHMKACLTTLFGHILNAEEDLLRERAIRFLALKLFALGPTLPKEVEEFVIEESKKVLQDVAGDEFALIISLLSHLPQYQTVTGRQQLVDLITEQADLDKRFSVIDSDRLEQIMQCMKQALPLFSVFPVLNKLVEFSSAPDLHLELLRLCADSTPFCGDLEDADKLLGNVFDRLMTILPAPPSEDEKAADGIADEPNLEFSQAECLIWILHELGKKHSDFFVNENRLENVKDFKKRLQYFARLIQVYSKKLREALAGKSKEELSKDENKIKIIALRTTANIQALVKDFLHSPPSFRSTIVPSWRPAETSSSTTTTVAKRDRDDAVTIEQKRKAPRKDNIAIYEPPSGKFSEKAGSFRSDNSSNGFRGRGGRFGRGRGVY